MVNNNLTVTWMTSASVVSVPFTSTMSKTKTSAFCFQVHGLCSFEPTEEERQKEREKREISHDFCVPQLSACQQVTQAVSLSTMKPVTQPANKPTAPFHSVGPLAWDQVMPLNKELLSCITSPQRGHPGRSLLSPGSASLQHTRPPPHRPLLCFLFQPFSH